LQFKQFDPAHILSEPSDAPTTFSNFPSSRFLTVSFASANFFVFFFMSPP